MNYASLNFTLDIILILVSLGFLIREYPARTFFLTVLCIASYLLPISLLENALDAQAPVAESTAATAPANTDENPSDPSSQIRDQVQQLAKADPTQTTRNVTGIWNLVLNGLNGVPGSNSCSTIDVNRAMAERAGTPLPGTTPGTGGTGSSPSSNEISMSSHFQAIEQALLDGRFGYTLLRPREVIMVDQFWFMARCCLLLGAAYFLLFDWKITLSIVSLGVIPVHYYMVLFYFLSLNWQKTRPWWGTMQAIGIALLVMVLLAIIGRQVLLCTGKHSFQIPDPGQYRARMGGLEYDYVILGNSLQLAGITLDLANSYLDEKNRGLLRFTSGAAIEFIPRNQN